MFDSCKMVQKQSEAFHTFLWHFSKFKTQFSSKVSDCIFEIHQLWQSDFSRVYYNCCCSYSLEPEIIKIGQSSHKMYSNNILNFEECTIILNAHAKKVWKLIVCTSYFVKIMTVGIQLAWDWHPFPMKDSVGKEQTPCKTDLNLIFKYMYLLIP